MNERIKKAVFQRLQFVFLGIGLVIAYLSAYAFALSKDSGKAISTCYGEAINHLASAPPLNTGLLIGVLASIPITALISYFLYTYALTKYTDERFSADFMTKKEKEAYDKEYIEKDPPVADVKVVQEKLKALDTAKEEEAKKIESEINSMYSTNVILSKNYQRPLVASKIVGNNNNLIVGGSGAGKTAMWLLANVMQMNASYIINDPSGEILAKTGTMLKNNGYKVKIFNIADMKHSNSYNPLKYIRDDKGVAILIECLISNTNKGDGSKGDNQYFEDAEKLLYSALIFLLRDYYHDESRINFATITDLVLQADADETKGMDFQSALDKIFAQLPCSSLARKFYDSFKKPGGKTLKSVISSCIVRLRPFLTEDVRNLTSTDEMELDKIGDEKTALFIVTPTAENAYAFLGSMLHTQTFETLYHLGEQREANGEPIETKIPVRFLLDEFANGGKIPYFLNKESTVRKYGIDISIILQDMSQIKAMYETNAPAVIGNCSNTIYLGSNEAETLKWFSELLGERIERTKTTGTSKSNTTSSSENYQETANKLMSVSQLRLLKPDECIVLTQNKPPVIDKKYPYWKHPAYKQTWSAKDKELQKNIYAYLDMPEYNVENNGLTDSLLRAKSYGEFVRSYQRKTQNVDSIKTSDNKQMEMKKIQFDEEKELKLLDILSMSYRNDIEKLVKDKPNAFFIGQTTTPLSMVKKTLNQLTMLYKDLPGAILFTEYDEYYLIGLGVAKDKKALYKKMNNECVKSLVDKEDYLATIVSKARFEEYKERVQQ